METKKISLKYLTVRYIFLTLAALLFAVVLTHPASATISIDFNNYTQNNFNLLYQDGAWCWFQEPTAVFYNGTNYIGFVNSSGSIKIISYDGKTTENYILHANLQVDDHAAPSILIRPDGRILVAYSTHDGTNMYYRISTNPEDITSWGSELTAFTGLDITYPQFAYLPTEGKTYLFFRYFTNNSFVDWYAINSTDNGTTWGSPVKIIHHTNYLYVKIEDNKNDTIHFIASGHPYHENQSIFYMKYNGGSFYYANGTIISQPINLVNMDVVYKSGGVNYNKSWIDDIALNSTGSPIVVFTTFPSTIDHRYNYASYTNSWNTKEITAAGGTIASNLTQDPGNVYYSGGVALDHENPNRVYLSKQTPDGFQIEQGDTIDGSSWNFSRSMSNISVAKNIRPVAIRNHSANFAFVWMGGNYSDWISYQTDIYINNYIKLNYSLNGAWWSSQGIQAPLLSPNTKCYYSLSEINGTIVYGISNKSNGIPDINCEGRWHGENQINSTIGTVGRGMNLWGGLHDYIELSPLVSFANKTAGTISLDYKPLKNPSNNLFLYYEPTTVAGNTRFGLLHMSSGDLLGVMRDTNTGSAFTTTRVSPFTVNVWSNISQSVDTTTDIMNLFYNYTLVNNNTAAKGAFTAGAPGDIITIGYFPSLATYIYGSFDEIYLSDVAETPSQQRFPTSFTPIFYAMASSGNVVVNVTLAWGGGNANNNASIYSWQNGTTHTEDAAHLIQTNAVSGTAYNIPNSLQFNDMDFGILMQGDGTNTGFIESLVGGEAPVSLPTITLSNTTGNFYVNHSITLSGGNQTFTSINWSVNGIWDNTSLIMSKNNTYSPHGSQNVTVCGYDDVNGVTGTCVSQNTQIPNNFPVPITTIHATYLVTTGETLNLSINSTDADGDNLTYSSNNTIGTFNTSTGNFTYTGLDLDAGNYTISFTVDDGHGGVVTQVTTITVQSSTDAILAAIKNQPVMVSSPGFDGILPIIAFISLIVYKKLYYKRKH